MRVPTWIMVAFSVAFPLAAMAAEGDPAAGKARAEAAGCFACHGADGVATADALARAGAHVVLAVRDAERGKAAAATIADGTGSVEVRTLDLADLASVRSFAARDRPSSRIPIHARIRPEPELRRFSPPLRCGRLHRCPVRRDHEVKRRVGLFGLPIDHVDDDGPVVPANEETEAEGLAR